MCMLGGVYTAESGRPYTPFQRYTTAQLNLPPNARKEILLEPRGSERNDFYNNIDLRAEKAFRVQQHRFGVFADIINLFNTATVTSRQASAEYDDLRATRFCTGAYRCAARAPGHLWRAVEFLADG